MVSYRGLGIKRRNFQASILRTQWGRVSRIFVTRSWPDIARKLQKMNRWNEKQIEELCWEAQKVFVKTGEERQRQKAKIMVTTVEMMEKKKEEIEIP